jgi:hypothetical protein
VKSLTLRWTWTVNCIRSNARASRSEFRSVEMSSKVFLCRIYGFISRVERPFAINCSFTWGHSWKHVNATVISLRMEWGAFDLPYSIKSQYIFSKIKNSHETQPSVRVQTIFCTFSIKCKIYNIIQTNKRKLKLHFLWNLIPIVHSIVILFMFQLIQAQ